MASPFSSPTITDSEIDAIIAEATDLHELEQIASLNTAHLSDSPFPINLETRLQKLKSFPPSINNEKSPKPDIEPDPLQGPLPNKKLDIGIEEELPTFHEEEKIPNSLNRRNVEPKSLEVAKEGKMRSGSSSSSSSLLLKQICCCFSPFGCSPNGHVDDDGGGVGDEILREFGSAVSIRKQRRKLKKAWRDHEKASEEAEKMVEWVKQVSAKINEATIDELLKEEFN